MWGSGVNAKAQCGQHRHPASEADAVHVGQGHGTTGRSASAGVGGKVAFIVGRARPGRRSPARALGSARVRACLWAQSDSATEVRQCSNTAMRNGDGHPKGAQTHRRTGALCTANALDCTAPAPQFLLLKNELPAQAAPVLEAIFALNGHGVGGKAQGAARGLWAGKPCAAAAQSLPCGPVCQGHQAAFQRACLRAWRALAACAACSALWAL